MQNMFRNLISVSVYLFTMASCSTDWLEQLLRDSAARQVDITEIVPIHSSSLKYFDFAIRYMDNTGREQRDTVREGASLSRDCFMRTFSYTEYAVACNAVVELIPQVPVDEVVSFTFIIPKPFLIPLIQSSSKRGAASTEDFNSKWYEEISIDSIPMDEFLTKYGRIFTSSCQVLEDYDGIQIVSN